MMIWRSASVRAVALTALGIVPLLLTACGNSSSQSTGEVQLGVASPQTGPDAVFGVQLSNAVKLAVDEANKKGGLPAKITVNVQDDQEKPAVGATVARLFCDQKNIIGVVGDFASTVTSNSQVVYNGCGLAQVTVSSRDDLTAHGFKNFFRTSAINSDASAKAASYVAKNLPQIHNIATINTNDATSVEQTKLFADDAKQLGLSVVAQISVTANQSDYRGALASLIAKKPDMIYMPILLNDAALLTKQSREQGFKGQILGGDALDDPTFVNIAGAANAEGVLIAELGYDPAVTPSAAAFVSAYKNAYGGNSPNVYATQAYDAATAIITAWKAAGGGTDRAKIVDQVAKVDFQGALGPIAFDEKGDLKSPAVGIFKVQGGKISFLGPA